MISFIFFIEIKIKIITAEKGTSYKSDDTFYKNTFRQNMRSSKSVSYSLLTKSTKWTFH